MSMVQPMADNGFTPRMAAAAIAFDALYAALKRDNFAEDDKKPYRDAVRLQITKLLIKIGEKHGFDFVLPS